jgi:paraquat-inducible protein A
LYVGIDLYLTKARRLGYLWELYGRIYPKAYVASTPAETDAILPSEKKRELGQEEVIRCPVCEAVNIDRGGAIECHRCHSRIYRYPKFGVSRTWALLITAMVLYFPANFYSVLEIKNLLGHSSNTIIGGVIALWDQGSYPIALIIFLASVLIPILKFILLLYLLISVHYPVAESKTMRHRFHALIEVIGPWSMVDVFVVTILTGLVKYESFTILAGTGATAFVLMVFFTMLAALSFDPRLIQDHKKRRQNESGTTS